VNVANVQHQRDIGIGVDRVDELRRRVQLGHIGWRSAVGRVAVHGERRRALKPVFGNGIRPRNHPCHRKQAERQTDRQPQDVHVVLSFETPVDERATSVAQG
jgi:hypothetical protein